MEEKQVYVFMPRFLIGMVVFLLLFLYLIYFDSAMNDVTWRHWVFALIPAVITALMPMNVRLPWSILDIGALVFCLLYFTDTPFLSVRFFVVFIIVVFVTGLMRKMLQPPERIPENSP